MYYSFEHTYLLLGVIVHRKDKYDSIHLSVKVIDI